MHSFDLQVFITSFLSRFAIFFIEMVDVKKEQVCIKFCFKLGTNAAKTHKILQQAFGDDILDHTQSYNWFNEHQFTVTNV